MEGISIQCVCAHLIICLSIIMPQLYLFYSKAEASHFTLIILPFTVVKRGNCPVVPSRERDLGFLVKSFKKLLLYISLLVFTPTAEVLGATLFMSLLKILWFISIFKIL